MTGGGFGEHAFGAVLRVPRVTPLLVVSLASRLPEGMNPLAMILYANAVTGSFGSAGLVAGLQAIGMATSTPVKGRMVDRLGQRATLVPLAIANVAALCALIVVGTAEIGLWPLAGCALVAGITFPPAGAAMRVLWPALLHDRRALLGPAYALDTVVFEVAFILGPLTAAIVFGFVSAAAPLVLSAVVILVGTVLFTRLAGPYAARVAVTGPSHPLGALRSPGIRLLALAAAPVGFYVGALEVGFAGFSELHDHPGAAGALIAVWGVGSAAGGMIYGRRARVGHPARRQLLLALALPLLTLPLTAAPSLLAMVPLALLAGLPLAPLIAVRTELVAKLAPRDAMTEAFLWPGTMLMAGLAIGAAAAGTLVERTDWRMAIAAAAGAAAFGALHIALRRAALATAWRDEGV